MDKIEAHECHVLLDVYYSIMYLYTIIAHVTEIERWQTSVFMLAMHAALLSTRAYSTVLNASISFFLFLA